MTKLREKLKFSDTKVVEHAVKIRKWHDTNFFDTLCLYCADNGINLNNVDDNDFNMSVEMLSKYGQFDKSTGHFYFWIATKVPDFPEDFKKMILKVCSKKG